LTTNIVAILDSFIKMFDVGKKIIVHNLPSSYLPGRVVFFLMNLHIIPRPIFLVRVASALFSLLLPPWVRA
jgi:hypothetical protein